MAQPFSKSLLLALLISLGVFALDQITKVLVVHYWPQGYRHVIIENGFDFVHWRNTGAAWGMFDGHPFILGLISVTVFILMLKFFRTLTEEHRLQELGFGLILGGVAGNLLDRFARGSVVDFLFFYHNSFQWPAFNVADSGITIGVTLYVGSVFWHSCMAKKPDSMAV